jgi:predicted enzyme related to lactoylglutathione lyase
MQTRLHDLEKDIHFYSNVFLNTMKEYNNVAGIQSNMFSVVLKHPCFDYRDVVGGL